ncbi:hypothetical protein HMI56_003971, partial [Coelomomyces lativittatus]
DKSLVNLYGTEESKSNEDYNARKITAIEEEQTETIITEIKESIEHESRINNLAMDIDHEKEKNNNREQSKYQMMRQESSNSIVKQAMNTPIPILLKDLMQNPDLGRIMNKQIYQLKENPENKNQDQNKGNLKKGAYQITMEDGSIFSAKCWYINLEINGRNYEALLDKGSEINVMKESVASSIGKEINRTNQIGMHGVNGGFQKTKGEIQCIGKLGNIEQTLSFCVVEKLPDEIILGTPFYLSFIKKIEFMNDGKLILEVYDKYTDESSTIMAYRKGKEKKSK